MLFHRIIFLFSLIAWPTFFSSGSDTLRTSPKARILKHRGVEFIRGIRFICSCVGIKFHAKYSIVLLSIYYLTITVKDRANVFTVIYFNSEICNDLKCIYFTVFLFIYLYFHLRPDSIHH